MLGKKTVVWRCVNRLEEKGSDCHSQTIAEEVLQTGVTIAINQITVFDDKLQVSFKSGVDIEVVI